MKNRLTYFVKCARPGFALALAYAFALQVLLASVVAAGMAATPQAGTVAICYGSADEAGQQPSHSPAHLTDCALSCAQGFAAAAILPDVAPAFTFAAGGTIKGVQLAALDVPLRPSPKLAQGPPSDV